MSQKHGAERVRNTRVLNTIVGYVNRYKTQEFDRVRLVHEQEQPRRMRPWDDDEFLEQLAEKTAYQATRADRLEGLFMKPFWWRAFATFKVDVVARLRPKNIERVYWDRLKPIRFPAKIARIVDSAKVIRSIRQESGDFGAYLKSFRIPPRIRKEKDVRDFWRSVERLRADMEQRGMPSLWRWPTLLHFLMEDMGYDCVKPDVVAMRVGYVTGIVRSTDGDENQRSLVEAVQCYALDSNVRPPDMDTYLLCFGGQSSTVDYVTKDFPTCRSDTRCTNRACPVGAKGLCIIRTQSR